jgi:hypothetical protein
VKNGGKTVVDHATSRHVDRRYHQHVLAQRAGREQTTGDRRPQLAAVPSERKQTGRRYGPAPANPPHPRMQAPAPMRPDVRREVYASTGSALMMTRRQMCQWERMAARDGHDEFRSPSGKGSATPKRRASR